MKAHYDTYDYPSYWKGRDYEHESELMAIDKLMKMIPKLETVMDIGAGFGRLAPSYLTKTKKAILLEPSQNLLQIAKENLKKKSRDIKYVCCELEDANSKLDEKCADLILMVRVIHHLKNPQTSIAQLNKLLKKNGYLILEFANKIHGKAVFKSICSGDFTFPIDLTTTDRRCLDNQNKKVIPFYNYHPDAITDALKSEGFEIKKFLSVSNVRTPFIKKNLPFPMLLSLENAMQNHLSKIYFGPSIFVLAQKT